MKTIILIVTAIIVTVLCYWSYFKSQEAEAAGDHYKQGFLDALGLIVFFGGIFLFRYLRDNL